MPSDVTLGRGEAVTAAANEDALYAKITKRLMPVLLTAFCIAYLDRINIGLAKLQMAPDLGLSNTAYGLGAGIFYLAYVVFEIPSNLILHRLGARRWIARIAISWGLVSMAMMFVRGTTSFYVLRILLGIAECGMFPGIILYLTCWYPAHRRSRMIAMFMAALPLSGLVGGPLSGSIMHMMAGLFGLRGWQWLFCLEGAPALVIGAIIWRVLPDRVSDAQWLTDQEKRIVLNNIASENGAKPKATVKLALTSLRIWSMSLILFSFAIANMGISFWLPTIVQRAGHENALAVGMLTAIPYAFAAFAMVALAMSSDRTRERRWHIAFPAFCGAGLLAISPFWSDNLTATIVIMTAASMCVFAVAPLMWSQPTLLLRDKGAAAGIALISSVGNLAGLFSPTLFGFLTDHTHSTAAGILVLAVFMVIGGLIALAAPAQLVNR
jgi:D-galactonate transporter